MPDITITTGRVWGLRRGNVRVAAAGGATVCTAAASPARPEPRRQASPLSPCATSFRPGARLWRYWRGEWSGCETRTVREGEMVIPGTYLRLLRERPRRRRTGLNVSRSRGTRPQGGRRPRTCTRGASGRPVRCSLRRRSRARARNGDQAPVIVGPVGLRMMTIALRRSMRKMNWTTSGMSASTPRCSLARQHQTSE